MTSAKISKDLTNTKVVVGSTNKLKIRAVSVMLSTFFGVKFNVSGLKNDFKSAVSEYPVGKPETYQGAKFRAMAAYNQNPNTACLYFGIESGFLYKNMDTISIQSVRNPNVIISVVMLEMNDSSVTDNNSKAEKEISKDSKIFTETKIWSEILKCPITNQQRFKQISDAVHSLILSSNLYNSKLKNTNVSGSENAVIAKLKN